MFSKILKNRHSKSFIQRGFTIIELLVVIMIISIVASLGANTFQNQRKQVRYNEAIVHVLRMIQTARNHAMTSYPVFDSSKPVGQESYSPEEGYGVYVSRGDVAGETRFILFANNASTTGVSKNQFDSGKAINDVIEEVYVLPSEVILNDLLTGLSPVTPLSSHTNVDENEAVILFRPLSGDAYLAANDYPLNEGLLTEPADLYLEFRKNDVDPSIPSTYIHINRVASFPEILNP